MVNQVSWQLKCLREPLPKLVMRKIVSMVQLSVPMRKMLIYLKDLWLRNSYQSLGTVEKHLVLLKPIDAREDARSMLESAAFLVNYSRTFFAQGNENWMEGSWGRPRVILHPILLS